MTLDVDAYVDAHVGRIRAGEHAPPGCQYVGRPGPYGNPWKVGARLVDPDAGAAVIVDDVLAVALFDRWAHHSTDRRAAWIRENVGALVDVRLLCWCRPPAPCHARVLARMALVASGRLDLAPPLPFDV